MLAHELRQLYVDFFKERGHLHLPSAPLVPIDVLGEADNTTLFTGSGMQQFKPFFTGAATPPNARIATVQKCVRTGDIDEVGDFSHCTFFEMLGNFSFGDYFKAEVIPWTWEFLTQKVGLDPDRFTVTVYLDDDEAYDIWKNVVGLPEDRIHRLGEDKNYWPANAISEGIVGPCGPCSEVYYRVAPLEEMTSDPSLNPTECWKIDDDAGRWLEVWNNVFTQFDLSLNEQGESVLTPLPKKNNDTGAGFDRIVQVHQGKRSVFETDMFQPIFDRAAELAGRAYGGTMEPADFALRVIAEHSRTMVFCIADGILPSNEGRGYVLRYIMRRAMRYGKTVLGLDRPFLCEVAPKVIEQMGGFYTELVERRELILQTIRAEEERFHRTLANGVSRLNELIERAKQEHEKTLSGEDAFTLYDTYGFPFELTRDIAAEQGLDVDESGYLSAKAEQQQRSRDASAPKAVWAEGDNVLSKLQQSAPPTDFLGYTQTSADAEVAGIVLKGNLVETARAGDDVEIVLNRTPFYAESGGQVGDKGLITAAAGDTTCAVRIEVNDTQKQGSYWLHKGRVLEGEVYTGQQVHASVDAERRRHIKRNHTTTHLLQAALRQVLGSHVHQKGSLVAPSVLRFDFTHTQPMTAEEIWQVEDRVNRWILEDDEVKVHQDVPVDEAKQRGAMALFGEKYGDRVRMIEVPGISLELCGGTHLNRTSEAVLFKITSESGIGSGVRRIEAQTGRGAIDYVNDLEKRLEQVAKLLKSNPRDVLVAAEKILKDNSDLQRQLQKAFQGAAKEVQVQEIDVFGKHLFVAKLGETVPDHLKAVIDQYRQLHPVGTVVVSGGIVDGQPRFYAGGTADITQSGFHAGKLVSGMASIAGGGGGGRPDFAQAGGKDASKLQDALEKAEELVKQQLQR